MDSKEIDKLQAILDRYTDQKGSVISILQDLQKEFGYIPKEAVLWMAEKTGIHASKFYGVATFYSQFFMKPRGKNIITACCGTVCYVKGSHRILFQLQEELGFPKNDATTKDGLFTLDKVACLGACSIAPVVVINKKVHGRMTPDKVVKKLKAIKENSSE